MQMGTLPLQAGFQGRVLPMCMTNGIGAVTMPGMGLDVVRLTMASQVWNRT